MLPAAPHLETHDEASQLPSENPTAGHLLQIPTSSLFATGPSTGHFEVDKNILLSPPGVVDALDDASAQASNRASLDTINRRNLDAYAFNRLSTQEIEPEMNGLQIATDMTHNSASLTSNSLESDSHLRQSTSTASMPRRTPSVRAAFYSSVGSLSPGSALSSPQLAGMLSITPLPSPLELSKDPWKSYLVRSRKSSLVPTDGPQETSSSPPGSPPRGKTYNGLRISSGDAHSKLAEVTTDSDSSGHVRNRSISDYQPEVGFVSKARNITATGNDLSYDSGTNPTSLHREQYLAVQRGLAILSPPIKVPSRLSNEDRSSGEEDLQERSPKRVKANWLTAESVASGHSRKYEIIRQLGQGTFSKVFLAVRQVENDDSKIDFRRASSTLDGVQIRSRRLVAIKVVEQGPAGGADSERVEVSLRREIEVLKAINHPSLVHLKAFGKDHGRSLLVLNYCQGGDLFEVASSHVDILVPSLVRRIFAELVSAVRYLHQKYIVHRDIKLENVLLNIPVQFHSEVRNWQTIDRAVVTLTDLGLSRTIPRPPESPLLSTRCGSEDWAAPELLMGQQYDGRQTDAWALGVLLYALMEGRLPFDPLPNAKGDPVRNKARTPHRIARCEWQWVKYGDEDGEWDPVKGKDYEDARPIVEGLLKRVSRRTGLEQVREMGWVKNGIDVDGGLRRVEEDAM